MIPSLLPSQGHIFISIKSDQSHVLTVRKERKNLKNQCAGTLEPKMATAGSSSCHGAQREESCSVSLCVRQQHVKLFEEES